MSDEQIECQCDGLMHCPYLANLHRAELARVQAERDALPCIECNDKGVIWVDTDYSRTPWKPCPMCTQLARVQDISGLKAHCDETFRDAYDGLVLQLTMARNAALDDGVPAEWYRRWWRAQAAMGAILDELR